MERVIRVDPGCGLIRDLLMESLISVRTIEDLLIDSLAKGRVRVLSVLNLLL